MTATRSPGLKITSKGRNNSVVVPHGHNHHRRGVHGVNVKRGKALHRRTSLELDQENKVRDVFMEWYAKCGSENENTFGRRQDARQADE